MTERMEKMNLVQLDLQTEVVEKRNELEKERLTHKEEVDKVGRGGEGGKRRRREVEAKGKGKRW
jgi:hypothetical protein